MREKFLSWRLPTIIGLIVIFSSIWITSYLIKRGVINLSIASSNANPTNVKIANITDSSFTVTFTTGDKTISAINYGEDTQNLTTAYDERDKNTNSKNNYFSHFITASNLKPNTKYSFSISSGGKTYLDNNQYYIVTTGPKIEIASPQQKPIQGNILLTDGTSASDTLVYLSIKDAQTIATVTKPDGTYVIDTSAVRGTKLDNYFVFQNGTPFSLDATRGNDSSSVSIFYKNAIQIPTIILSQNYDFTAANNQEQIATQASGLTVPVENVAEKVDITSVQNNQNFIDQQPTFQGTAVPGKVVKITIHSSDQISASVVTDSLGQWYYRPDSTLSPGTHTITIQTVDFSGITQTITKQFTVFAQGTQVVQSATPSATMTPTPAQLALGPTTAPTSIPTPTKTPTITSTTTTVTPTFTPTSTPIPTATIAPKPTSTSLTSTTSSTQTAQTTMAPTGSSLPTIVLMFASLFLIIIGTIFFFVL